MLLAVVVFFVVSLLVAGGFAMVSYLPSAKERLIGARLREVAQPGPIEVLGAPEVSRDCRTLPYLHQATVETVTTTKLMMARR
jgi:hypothetical protein